MTNHDDDDGDDDDGDRTSAVIGSSFLGTIGTHIVSFWDDWDERRLQTESPSRAPPALWRGADAGRVAP